VKKKKITNGRKFDNKINNKFFLKLSNTFFPAYKAVKIPPKSSFIKTISAFSSTIFDAEVPKAIPTSDVFRAGRSFNPSPIKAINYP
jgi:hypothetical protein